MKNSTTFLWSKAKVTQLKILNSYNKIKLRWNQWTSMSWRSKINILQKNKIEIKSPQESKPEANIDEAIENSYCKSLQRIKTHETTAEMDRTENQWTRLFDLLL